MFKADLHCHSTASDGSETPTAVVERAKALGLTGLALTDHDTTAGFSEAYTRAKELELPFISGVEFSSVMNEEPVHILGYSFDPDHPHLLNLSEEHIKRRIERNEEMVELLRKQQMPIEPEDLYRASTSRIVGRPHIALAMIKRGYVSTIKEAFVKYLGEGKSCYAPGRRFTVQETIDVIHQAGGVAVIAHPHLIKRGRIMRRLLELDFDGIECYYANMSFSQNGIWLRKAKEEELLITGGSDFHGAIKPQIELGAAWTPKESFDELLSLFHENYRSAL